MLTCFCGENNALVGVSAIILSLLWAGPVAACDGAKLLECQIEDSQKHLTLCFDQDEVIYKFGALGAPELELHRDLVDVGHTPWAGVGRSIWNATSLTAGDVIYEVYFSADRLSEQPGAIGGGVTVTRGGKMLADLACDPKTLVGEGDPSPLYKAKIAAGQVYDRETGDWR